MLEMPHSQQLKPLTVLSSGSFFGGQMINLQPKKNHTRAYVTQQSMTQVLKAFDCVPSVLPNAVVRSASPYDLRIEAPGVLITVMLQAAQGGTRLITKFKSCAQSAWRRIMEFIHASVQVRSADANSRIVLSAPAAGRVSRSVGEVVKSFVHDASKLVRFAPKALRQAEDSGFRHPEQVTQALNALATAAGLLNAGVPSGLMIRDLYQLKAGLRGYRPRLSDTQLTAYRNDYVAVYDGEEFVGEMHVTIGVGGEADCLSIHWAYCPKRRLIIITRCGTHGRSARS